MKYLYSIIDQEYKLKLKLGQTLMKIRRNNWKNGHTMWSYRDKNYSKNDEWIGSEEKKNEKEIKERN